MAEAPLNDGSKLSRLQDLLPSLTDKEIENLYHAKMRFLLDKSIKATRQIEDLERDIDILAAEMKLRDMAVRAKSTAKNRPVEVIELLPVQKRKLKKKTKKDSNLQQPSAVESTTTTESKTFTVYNKKFEEERKKVIVLWPPQKGDHSSLKQKINNYFELKVRESQPDFEQVDYQVLKEKYDALLDEYMELSKFNGELLKPSEEDNLFSLAIRPTTQVVKSLPEPPSEEPSNKTLDSSNFVFDLKDPENMTLSDFIDKATNSANPGSKTTKNEAGTSTTGNSGVKKEA